MIFAIDRLSVLNGFKFSGMETKQLKQLPKQFLIGNLFVNTYSFYTATEKCSQNFMGKRDFQAKKASPKLIRIVRK